MAILGERAHLKTVCWMRRSNALLMLLTVGYVVYLAVGGIFFMVVETPTEEAGRFNLRKLKKELLQSHPCLTEETLQSIILEISNVQDLGISIAENITEPQKWSFGQAVFFAATVLTTIGYGNVTPLTKEGKLFCIIYATIGIPVTLLLLTAYVERLMQPATIFRKFLQNHLGHIYQPFVIQIIHLIVIMIAILICFFFLPAWVLMFLEPNWTYLDSLYYCFISLTSIGLGDYVPGENIIQKYRTLYKICLIGYLLIGLTFMMFFLALVSNIRQLDLGFFFLPTNDEVTTDAEKMKLQDSYSSIKCKYTEALSEIVPHHPLFTTSD